MTNPTMMYLVATFIALPVLASGLQQNEAPGLRETSSKVRNTLEETEVVLQSPTVTNWGRWGRWAQCKARHSYVTGFQLKVEPRENRIDNTALNGITLSCGIPEQKEIERISSAKGPWGAERERLFCENGPVIGLQLKVQSPQGEGDDVASINVKAYCQDGQILEGYQELEEYPDSNWTEPIICPDGLAVCGIQTQVEPRQWWRDDTSLNQYRIKCCAIPEDSHEGVPSTNPKLDFTLTFFKSYDGSGKNESFYLKYGKCYNLPIRWRRQVASVRKTTPCFRLWQHLGCSGVSRCYCDDDLLNLDETYTMSRSRLWYSQLTAVGPCHKYGRHEDEGYVEALLSSKDNQTSGLILAPAECLTFWEGDRWRGKTSKVILTKGCLDVYAGDACTGETIRVDKQLFHLDGSWEGKAVSVKNCGDHK